MMLSGKTVLITGSTDGIGLHTAKELVKLGATVLVHGRNEAKAQAAAKSVSQVSNGAKVHAYAADLSKLREVKDLAARVREDHPTLAELINNAGVFPSRMQVTEDGFEETWAVNVLAPFVLNAMLLQHVQERIINVSSISADSRLDFNNLNQEKGFSAHDAYGMSKLAMMMITKEMAERVQPPPTVNCLDPGTVNTKMLIAGWGRCGIEIEDADGELYLATAPELANVTGEYFVNNRKRRMPAVVHDKATRLRLWEIMEEHTGVKFPV